MRPKVVVGYPAGGSVTLPFAASIARLVKYEAEKPYVFLGNELLAAARAGRAITPRDVSRLLRAAQEQSLLGQMQHVSSIYIADNRTLLAQRFLETRADWLLQIDTDIEFPSTILEHMLRLAGDEKKILAASVPLGDDPTCAYLRTKAPGIYATLQTVPMEPIEVDGIATAVFLVHREVYETIAAERGQCWFQHIYLPDPKNPPNPTPSQFKFISQGEDLAFCARAQEAGFKVWCVHLPGLKHFKTKPLSHDSDVARAMALANEGDAMGELVAEG